MNAKAIPHVSLFMTIWCKIVQDTASNRRAMQLRNNTGSKSYLLLWSSYKEECHHGISNNPNVKKTLRQSTLLHLLVNFQTTHFFACIWLPINGECACNVNSSIIIYLVFISSAENNFVFIIINLIQKHETKSHIIHIMVIMQAKTLHDVEGGEWESVTASKPRWMNDGERE